MAEIFTQKLLSFLEVKRFNMAGNLFESMADSRYTNTYDYNELRDIYIPQNKQYSFYNQLIWNWLLMTEPLKPNDWSVSMLYPDVLLTQGDLFISNDPVLYRVGTVSITPSYLILVIEDEVYTKAAMDIGKKLTKKDIRNTNWSDIFGSTLTLEKATCISELLSRYNILCKISVQGMGKLNLYTEEYKCLV